MGEPDQKWAKPDETERKKKGPVMSMSKGTMWAERDDAMRMEEEPE